MSDILTVARYIVSKYKTMQVQKLHKYCYYAQAWHMVWWETPLFEEDFRLSNAGPISNKLYGIHGWTYRVGLKDLQTKETGSLEEHEKQTIDKVIEFYKNDESHTICSRANMEVRAFSRKIFEDSIIPKRLIYEYYKSL